MYKVCDNEHVHVQYRIINTSAMIPLYNHVPKAFPATNEDLQPPHKEILSFLWTKIINAETFQIRRLVARK
jgi:hypothetical protein